MSSAISRHWSKYNQDATKKQKDCRYTIFSKFFTISVLRDKYCFKLLPLIIANHWKVDFPTVLPFLKCYIKDMDKYCSIYD